MRFRTMLALACVALPALAQSSIGNPRLMQGPMIGAVTTSSIPVWIRASGEFECWLEYSTSPTMADAQTSEALTARKDNDYCLVLTAEGLKPETTYYYRVYVHENVATNLRNLPPFNARTAPAAPFKGSFRVAFGSCARYHQDPVQPIWPVLQTVQPDLFFWVGDNIYGDTLDPDILAEEYRRQRDLPAIIPLIRSVPQLATWDDHDFALNDHDRTNPVKEGALRVFEQYWPNPSYGLPDTPGVFFTYHYGGVDFFFLDCRYHRDPNKQPDTPEKTFLGADQLQWLKNGLNASTAPFKVLVCGSGFNNGKGPGGDSWSSALHERNALFDFIRDEAIGGVILMSGDTHVGELNAIPWSERGGYDLYELVSSPLAQTASTNLTGRSPEARIRTTYNLASNAGLLEFDFSGQTPVVRMNLINHFGNLVWSELTIAADELVNGTSTWKDKQDAAARRMDALTAATR